MLPILVSLVERFPNVDEEAKWAVIKNHCVELLRNCDETQLPDSGLSQEKQMEWRDYRDQLKLIRSTFSNPDDVVLPIPPVAEIGS